MNLLMMFSEMTDFFMRNIRRTQMHSVGRMQCSANMDMPHNVIELICFVLNLCFTAKVKFLYFGGGGAG
jgi:hypothetical protein